jgi:hypothetical protein
MTMSDAALVATMAKQPMRPEPATTTPTSSSQPEGPSKRGTRKRRFTPRRPGNLVRCLSLVVHFPVRLFVLTLKRQWSTKKLATNNLSSTNRNSNEAGTTAQVALTPTACLPQNHGWTEQDSFSSSSGDGSSNNNNSSPGNGNNSNDCVSWESPQSFSSCSRLEEPALPDTVDVNGEDEEEEIPEEEVNAASLVVEQTAAPPQASSSLPPEQPSQQIASSLSNSATSVPATRLGVENSSLPTSPNAKKNKKKKSFWRKKNLLAYLSSSLRPKKKYKTAARLHSESRSTPEIAPEPLLSLTDLPVDVVAHTLDYLSFRELALLAGLHRQLRQAASMRRIVHLSGLETKRQLNQALDFCSSPYNLPRLNRIGIHVDPVTVSGERPLNEEKNGGGQYYLSGHKLNHFFQKAPPLQSIFINMDDCKVEEIQQIMQDANGLMALAHHHGASMEMLVLSSPVFASMEQAAEFLRHFTHLKILIVDDLKIAGTDDWPHTELFVEAIRPMIQLENVSLVNHHLTDAHVHRMVELLPELRQLRMSCDSRLTHSNAVLKSIVEFCPKLQVLLFNGNTDLTVAGIHHVLSHCPLRIFGVHCDTIFPSDLEIFGDSQSNFEFILLGFTQ